MLSIGLLMARELLSGRAFTADRIEPVVPVQRDIAPVLPVVNAAVPQTMASPPEVMAEPVVRNSEPDILQALRELRSSRSAAVATRVLLSAPSAASETAAAGVALARQLSREARTIMVDFDRQAPALTDLPVAAATSTPEGGDVPGLSELLAGEATFAEIIHRDSLSRLHVVPVGKRDLAENGHAEFALVLDALAETYDFVVMHAPSPDHSVTRTLSESADATVLLRAEGTSEAELKSARAYLEERSSGPVYMVSTSSLAGCRTGA